MEYRSLGRTGLRVSAVGFGTSQLRQVMPAVAVDTLLRGFDLGVNIVHTAPDYGDAEDLVAEAVARTPQKVIVASNAYDVHRNTTGRVRHFEKLFEATCRKLKTDRLDLFGIASVDDRQALGENVWGRRGMVEFVQKKKAQGRIGATFCTSHGSPEFNRKLIESGAFDAVMLSYTDLGFHLLTMTPVEEVLRNRAELFPLCGARGVGLMVMLPLAGGMLWDLDTPGRNPVAPPQRGLATEALRAILSNGEVSCVMPGTTSVAEAEENALAGHTPGAARSRSLLVMNEHVGTLRPGLCTRCGQCELTCSQKLPLRWLIRAAYMSLYANSPYETSEDYEYFKLHPSIDSTCSRCPEVTCVCPNGLDVRKLLVSLHEKMVLHMRRGLIAPPPRYRTDFGNRWFGARIVRRDLPQRMRAGTTYTCRLFLENRGLRPWHPPGVWPGSAVGVEVFLDDVRVGAADVRERVGRGLRGHFVFEVTAPRGRNLTRLRLQLARHHPLRRDKRSLLLVDESIPVGEE